MSYKNYIEAATKLYKLEIGQETVGAGKMNSKCCKAKVSVLTGQSCSYYICDKCHKPCDLLQGENKGRGETINDDSYMCGKK